MTLTFFTNNLKIISLHNIIIIILKLQQLR